jgi:hypothetical protein
VAARRDGLRERSGHALTVCAAVIDNRKAPEMSILHNVRMSYDTQKEHVQRDH